MAVPTVKIFTSWLVVVIWMTLIFWLSSIPDLRSGLQPLWDVILRKIAHAIEYGMLALLSYRAMRVSGWRSTMALITALVLAVAYAATDEFHQTFVAGRHGDIIDWGIDAVGAGTGLTIIKKI